MQIVYCLVSERNEERGASAWSVPPSAIIALSDFVILFECMLQVFVSLVVVITRHKQAIKGIMN